MKRYALVILVLIIILVNTLMHRAAWASPLDDAELWKLRHVLPAGVVGAALCLALIGMGAQIWRGILPLCGAEWSPQRAWSYMTVCGLWSGWIPLLCALTFYPLSAGMEAPGAPPQLLIGGFIVLILCRLLSLACRIPAVGLLTALITAAVALLCGHELCPQAPLFVLVAGLCSAPALHMLTEREIAPPFVWLTVAALFFCAYAAAFGSLLALYPPAEASSLPCGPQVAVAYALLGLALICFPALRRRQWGRRLSAMLILLLTAVWVYLHLSTASQPATAAIYVGALLLFCIPASLMLNRSTRL